MIGHLKLAIRRLHVNANILQYLVIECVCTVKLKHKHNDSLSMTNTRSVTQVQITVTTNSCVHSVHLKHRTHIVLPKTLSVHLYGTTVPYLKHDVFSKHMIHTDQHK